MVHSISGDAYSARFIRDDQVDRRSDRSPTSPDSSLTDDAADSTSRSPQRQDDGSAASLSISAEARYALKIASQSELRVEEDGSRSASNKIQTRFRYELQTDDGQQIQLHARAKIKQSVTIDGNGEAAIKTQVKLQFSMIQSDVSENVSPLLGGEASEDANPLQTFLGAVDNTVTAFADEGAIDADTLIHDVLDEFNLLLSELSGRFADTYQSPEIESPVDAAATEQVLSYPAIAAEPIAAEPIAAEPIAAEPIAAAPESEIQPSPETLAAENLVAETNAGDESVSIDSSPVAEPSAESAREVLNDVRIRFVLSFSEVIQTLSPGLESEESGLTVLQQRNSRFEAHLQYMSVEADRPENSTSYLA